MVRIWNDRPASRSVFTAFSTRWPVTFGTSARFAPAHLMVIVRSWALRVPASGSVPTT
ncbi:hypothetical protein HBB16_21365 [Pseudonocardia sp. MCCB 268]|nr:hypothetical protein [Pseudonocardia cytotoxica]